MKYALAFPAGERMSDQPALTDDELTVLTLAAQGESMAAIGRWERPIDHLVELGLMTRGDKSNNFITASGRASVIAADETEDADLRRAFDKARGGPVIEGEAEECPP